jgi:hypothetical protein
MSLPVPLYILEHELLVLFSNFHLVVAYKKIRIFAYLIFLSLSFFIFFHEKTSLFFSSF